MSETHFHESWLNSLTEGPNVKWTFYGECGMRDYGLNLLRIRTT